MDSCSRYHDPFGAHSLSGPTFERFHDLWSIGFGSRQQWPGFPAVLSCTRILLKWRQASTCCSPFGSSALAKPAVLKRQLFCADGLAARALQAFKNASLHDVRMCHACAARLALTTKAATRDLLFRSNDSALCERVLFILTLKPDNERRL